MLKDWPEGSFLLTVISYFLKRLVLNKRKLKSYQWSYNICVKRLTLSQCNAGKRKTDISELTLSKILFLLEVDLPKPPHGTRVRDATSASITELLLCQTHRRKVPLLINCRISFGHWGGHLLRMPSGWWTSPPSCWTYKLGFSFWGPVIQ